ncbi:hypothetical protein E5288_WYG013128 [Bos mutus]|uniref:Uncharacterized protein n=1 Tax=Bos mutus TaxID=72004 RepID=A0A6B0RDJ5_9CETA|nr:hypothetical protein [Bos mutus]
MSELDKAAGDLVRAPLLTQAQHGPRPIQSFGPVCPSSSRSFPRTRSPLPLWHPGYSPTPRAQDTTLSFSGSPVASGHSP